MPLGKTLLELANKGFDIRFVYGPMEPEPLFSDIVAMTISKGEWHRKIIFDVLEARRTEDAGIDECLEKALKDSAEIIMMKLSGENDGPDTKTGSD